jgi:hypothetical protein
MIAEGINYSRGVGAISSAASNDEVEQSILDFGDGALQAELVLTGLIVQPTTVVLVQMRLEATEDHTLCDLKYDPIEVGIHSIVDGIGFTIFGRMHNSLAHGKYIVDWLFT